MKKTNKALSVITLLVFLFTMLSGSFSAWATPEEYSITCDKYSYAYFENNGVQQLLSSAAEGDEVCVALKEDISDLPEEQYFTGYLIVDDGVSSQQVYDGCSFVMPAKPVTITTEVKRKNDFVFYFTDGSSVLREEDYINLVDLRVNGKNLVISIDSTHEGIDIDGDGVADITVLRDGTNQATITANSYDKLCKMGKYEITLNDPFLDYHKITFVFPNINQSENSGTNQGENQQATNGQTSYSGGSTNNQSQNTNNSSELTIKKVTAAKTIKKSKNFIVTVKLNKKVKGKLVYAVFNGKAYKAKTNKNGIAKIKIKKSALKKLGGKKVKYQVIYNNSIKNKTVKIKK